jgi:hypothetical protein
VTSTNTPVCTAVTSTNTAVCTAVTSRNTEVCTAVTSTNTAVCTAVTSTNTAVCTAVTSTQARDGVGEYRTWQTDELVVVRKKSLVLCYEVKIGWAKENCAQCCTVQKKFGDCKSNGEN